MQHPTKHEILQLHQRAGEKIRQDMKELMAREFARAQTEAVRTALVEAVKELKMQSSEANKGTPRVQMKVEIESSDDEEIKADVTEGNGGDMNTRNEKTRDEVSSSGDESSYYSSDEQVSPAALPRTPADADMLDPQVMKNGPNVAGGRAPTLSGDESSLALPKRCIGLMTQAELAGGEPPPTDGPAPRGAPAPLPLLRELKATAVKSPPPKCPVPVGRPVASGGSLLAPNEKRESS